MYHQHSQQQGPPQTFANRPHLQPQPNHGQQSRSGTNIISQVLGFQFPPPTQLPDELESALAIRGSRDIDHRRMDHINQHQNCHSSEPGGYSNNPAGLAPENQPGNQQGIDWSNYQQPSKLFATPTSSATHQPERHQLPAHQQQPQNMQKWSASDSPSPQAQGSQARVHSGNSSLDVQSLYTPESAGSILASFGLSNEDLEVLSHYPDDQLTPDTLPFILRNIQVNKSRSVHSMPASRSSPPVSTGRSSSPEVPSLLSVTQTAGKVIDYGHASRATEESSGRESFKREQLSRDRKVQRVYQSPPTSAHKHKGHLHDRRQVHLGPPESNKHGDLDYRRLGNDSRKAKRSPAGDFAPSSKSHRPDRDYRRDGHEQRTTSELQSKTLSSSRRSSPSTPHGSKRLPTPTMISDFSAEPPKVFPHTCSLCHIQCDQAEDWNDHVNTVNHTAACRDLRNKFPEWNPNISRRDRDGQRAPWHPKERSRSLSWSQSPPPSKYRASPHHHRQYRGPYPSHHRPSHQHSMDHGHHMDHHHSSGRHSPNQSRRGGSSSSTSHRPDRRARESSGSSSRSSLKRPRDVSAKHPTAPKPGQLSKPGPSQASTKVPTKVGNKPKAAGNNELDMTVKGPPAKKKKKLPQASTAAARLLTLTGIPADASEQEVTNLVGSFGKINNLILMTCSPEEGGDSSEVTGQTASLCMVRTEDAQALAQSTSLSIREQPITASLAKKTEGETSQLDPNKENTSDLQGPAAGGKAAGKGPLKTPKMGLVLISGLPESGWSEADIINLVQKFETPSDIIIAQDVRKALVWLPHPGAAAEIVKVHSFSKLKIQGSEVEIVNIKQPISLNTHVALYNLLKSPLDQFDAPVRIGWGRLLMISNVPSTPSGQSEVLKLVERFGSIHCTLVLNKNVIICQMETVATAQAVLKRFKKFPCIIQNHPLSFCRKADPKIGQQGMGAYYNNMLETSPANGKDGCSVTAPVPNLDSECTITKTEEEPQGQTEELQEVTALEGEPSKAGNHQTPNVEQTAEAPDSAQDIEPNGDAKAAPTKVTAEDPPQDKITDAAEGASEETKAMSCDATLNAPPDLPTVTPEMLEALLEECRTRTLCRQGQKAVPPAADGTVRVGTAEESGRAKEALEEGKKMKNPVKKGKEAEAATKASAQKEREARRERDRREERTWRDRERDRRLAEEEDSRRERYDRWRGHRAGSSGSKSSEGSRRSFRRGGQDRTTTAGKAKKVEPEEELDCFPFDLGDFVTVDEVGDVADLPNPLLLSEDTAEEAEDIEKEIPATVAPATKADAVAAATPETTHVPEGSKVHKSEPAPIGTPPLPSPDSTAVPIYASALDVAQTTTSTNQAIVSEPEAALGAEAESTLDSLTAAELLHTPAKATAESPPHNTDAPAAEIPSSLEDCSLHKTQGVEQEKAPAEEGEEKAASEKPDEEEGKGEVSSAARMDSPPCSAGQSPQPTPNEPAPNSIEAETKCQRSEDQGNVEDEDVKKRKKTLSDYALPPFDPNCPVGMECLIPKTGFFCKVCKRFFSGSMEAEISHAKTLKHYDNLQKYIQSKKTANTNSS